jgi:hypothetical protein
MIKSRRTRWAKHVTRVGEKLVSYSVLVGKFEGMRPLGRSRRSWENNIKMDLQEVGCGVMGWIDLAQVTGGWPS